MAKPKQEALWVYASQNGDGYTYSLLPTHEERVLELAPHALLSDRLFLAQDVSQDFVKSHSLMAPQILMLLTRLSVEELRAMGPWEFRRPNEKDELLLTWPNDLAAEKSAQSPNTKRTTAPSPKPPRSAQRKAAG